MKKLAIAAISCAALIIYLQLFAMPGLRQCALEKSGVNISPDVAKSCLKASYAVSSILLLISSGILAALLFKGQFRNLYQSLEKRRKEWVIVAAIVSTAALTYLSKGNVVLGDAMQFSALSEYLKNSMLSLIYPFWTFYWYLGSAPLAFYGWLSFFITGIVNIFTSIDWANKIVFFTAHIASALLAYRFAKTATNNTKASIIAGLAFGLSFEHIARIMVGRSLTAITYVLAPLLFLIIESRLKEKIGSGKTAGLIALTSGLLILNHQADALFIISIFAIYSGIRALEENKLDKKTRKIFLEVIAGMAIAAAMVSSWIIPMILEQNEASATGKALEILKPSVPNLKTVFELAKWPGLWGDKPLFYIGLSIIALAAAGLIYALKKRKFAVTAASVIAIGLLLFQSPRYMPAALLMLALLSAYGFEFASKKIRIEPATLLLIVSAIMIADLVPATAQLGYPDYSYNKQIYTSINAGDGERLLDLSTDRRTFWPAYAYLTNRQETVFGALIESAPRSLAYSAAIAQMAAHETYDLKENMSSETLHGLYLLGVKYAIIHEEQIGKNPEEVFAGKRGALGLERGLKVVELKQSPIIVSSRIERINYEPLLEQKEGWNIRAAFERREINETEAKEVINAMKINTETATAERILIKDGESQQTSANATITVESVKTQPGRATIIYSLSKEAFLQLSYSHSSHLSVRIDGKEVPYLKTAINTIAVKSEEGKHGITIEGKQSQTRKMLMTVSLITLLFSIYLSSRGKGATSSASKTTKS